MCELIAASATHTGSAIGAVTPGATRIQLVPKTPPTGTRRHDYSDVRHVNAYNAVAHGRVWSLFTPTAQTSAEHTLSTGQVTFESGDHG